MEPSTAPRFFTRILLTGPPGIGKTTICKKIVSLLNNTKYDLNGFYTEELRSTDNARIGFDIVSLKNNDRRTPLARTPEHLEDCGASKFRVGNYHVFVDKFERAVLPIFELDSNVLLVDEIGKMELLSKKFQDNVEKLFLSKEKRQFCVIATIPQRDRVPGRFAMFFERLYADKYCKVIEVNRHNRDNLPEIVIRMTEEILS